MSSLLTLLCNAPLILVLLSASQVSAETCRCIPNDDCWPSKAEWNSLNSTLDGKLIATIPLATVCHEPNYNAEQCYRLKEQWLTPDLHDETYNSIMAAAVANETCEPFTPIDTPCSLGNLPQYVVNATGPDDFASAIKFANEHNIRLVIRNTGHDYFGKSSGANSLSIWTHHLKDITFLDYDSAGYQGPAVKMQAGVQVIEAYAAADAQGMVVVGGDCPTVGVAGGYTQGGGTSPLSSIFGMGADQALEWEVIDGTGRLLTASPTENPQLYWALSGGGGGTYGIVYSLTVKAHKTMPVTGVHLNFTSANISQDAYYNAIAEYHHYLPSFTAAGAVSLGLVQGTAFATTPLVLPDYTVAEAEALLKPLRAKLDDLHVPHNFEALNFPTFYSFYKEMIDGIEFRRVHNAQYGGWFMPLDVMQTKYADVTSAFREIVGDGVAVGTLGINVSHTASSWNAVSPAWRELSMLVFLYTPWPEGADLTEMAAMATKMTNEWMPKLSSLAPDAGAYMNEADPNQPNWQEVFYGPNYNKLLSIKQTYDPHEIFYAWTAVGSDRWYENGNGALCRRES